MSVVSLQPSVSNRPAPRPAWTPSASQPSPSATRDSLKLASAQTAPRPQAPAQSFLQKLLKPSATSFDQILANDPSAIWNTQAMSPLTKAALTAYRRGQIGNSVRGLDLKGKSVEGIRSELRQRGFQQEVVPLRDFKTGRPIVNPRTGKAVPMEVWSHPDGGMVRLKPEGDPSSKHRPQPHASLSVKYPPDASGHDFNYEAFKLDGSGNPLPKWAQDANNPFGDTPAGKRFYDDLADRTHVDLQS